MSADLIANGYTKMTLPKMGKRKQFLVHWRNGRRDGFPICCILRFSIESALHDGKTFDLRTFKFREGIVHPKTKETFIPCHIFHR